VALKQPDEKNNDEADSGSASEFLKQFHGTKAYSRGTKGASKGKAKTALHQIQPFSEASGVCKALEPQ
jgi:hypothetical protein